MSAVVEEIQRLDTRVTRVETDISELKAILKDAFYLCMKNEMVAAQNEAAIAQLSQEMKVFKDEIRRDTQALKDEMKAFKEELRRDTQALKEEMKAFKDEVNADRKRMNKQWGELANRLGTIVEDIVAPNIEGVASRYFGCAELDSLMVRCKRRSFKDRSKRREFDVVAVCGDKVFLNETKSMPRMDYVECFIEFIRRGEFFDYFPEYDGFELIPIFASLYLSDDLVQVLTSGGIYAMAMADDSMELLNFDAVKMG